MPDMAPEKLDAIQAERSKIFTAPWFADLLGGKLGFGETYWFGLWIVPCIAMPLLVLLPYWMTFRAPAASAPVGVAFALFMTIWVALMLRALLIAKRRSGAAGGWVVTGLVWATLALIGLLAGVAMVFAG